MYDVLVTSVWIYNGSWEQTAVTYSFHSNFFKKQLVGHGAKAKL
jgi:hypothetical protein